MTLSDLSDLQIYRLRRRIGKRVWFGTVGAYFALTRELSRRVAESGLDPVAHYLRLHRRPVLSQSERFARWCKSRDRKQAQSRSEGLSHAHA